MKLRVLLNEGSAFEKNQCSIIHLAAGIEWQLQKRPNRLPLKNRVISTASELRIFEHHNASKMLEQFSKEESCTADERLLVDALVRDVLAANHDRDFRFWSLFCGEEIMCQNLCIRIVELNNRDARTGVYNFTSENWAGGEREVLYMLAYRGHMRFMKQSRLATDVRWEKWRGEFAQIFDMRLMKREDIKSLNELVAGVESRQCRHCPASCHVRLQYPGIGSAQAVPCRMAGHASKRHTRTNEQRRENKMSDGRRNYSKCLKSATKSRCPVDQVQYPLAGDPLWRVELEYWRKLMREKKQRDSATRLEKNLVWRLSSGHQLK